MSKIDKLADFFKSNDLPDPPIKLSSGETINDVKLFLESQFRYVRAYSKNKKSYVCMAYWGNLLRFKKLVEKHNE